MEFKEFVVIFAEALDMDNAKKLKLETKFRELDDWSSLSSLNLIAAVDDQLGIALDSSDIKNSSTIGEIFRIIKKKQE